jgi:glycerophosphoryl diester phosphodiesterase
MIVFITVWILLARPLLAWEAIAHRGVYHNMGDAHALAENSIEALLRAYDIGVRGVEFDLRLASDGGVLVVHDAVSNRVTADDNFGGVLIAIVVALNIQSPAPPISFDQLSASSWVNTPLKVFGANGRIVPPTGGTVPRLVTLDTLLARFKPLGGPEFWLFLDIEDPITLRSAGALVRKYALESVVFLKLQGRQSTQPTIVTVILLHATNMRRTTI